MDEGMAAVRSRCTCGRLAIDDAPIDRPPARPNVGLKLHAREVGRGIAEREQDETISYGVLDPSAFKGDGGPSIAERIARGSGGRVWLRHADNTRVPARGAISGWDQMRSRLVGDGRPMIATFSSCVDSIRTLSCDKLTG